VRLQLAKAYAHAHNGGAALSVLEQACARGINDPDLLRSDPDLASLAGSQQYRALLARLDLWGGIPGTRKNDRILSGAAAHLVPELGRGTVRVLADGNPVAMGLVMSTSGDVLTKASELSPGELSCVLTDGR